MPQGDDLSTLIGAIDARTPRETDLIVAGLMRRSWPSGPDRTDPVARGWLSRWSPASAPAAAPDCACAAGRCAWCN